LRTTNKHFKLGANNTAEKSVTPLEVLSFDA